MSWNLYAAAAAKSFQSCPTLCDPIDGSPPGSAVPGMLQAITLEWVSISFSQGMKVKSESEVAQSCLTLRDPRECSLSVSSVHGIFQARTLEWLVIAFSGNLYKVVSSSRIVVFFLKISHHLFLKKTFIYSFIVRTSHFLSFLLH